MKKKKRIVDDEMQDEMVGLLTAISIVSKRLAKRLLMLDKNTTESKANSNKKSEKEKMKNE